MSISPLQAVAGTDGRISVNTTNYNLNKYSVTPRVNDLITTNFESADAPGGATGLCEEGIMGVVGCDISFSGDYDLGAPPYGVFIPGTFVSTVKLYTSATNDVFFSFPSIRILTAKTDVDVNGKITIDVTAKSNGSFSYPT